MKIFTLIIILLTLSACAKDDNNSLDGVYKLMCSGFNYGYSLPKSTNSTPSGLAQSKHTQKCASLNSIIENRYCILGVIGKAIGREKPACSTIKNIRIQDATNMSRSVFIYAGYDHLVKTNR